MNSNNMTTGKIMPTDKDADDVERNLQKMPAKIRCTKFQLPPQYIFVMNTMLTHL